MFKRANKITALLVAAASIMSVVPAMAADSTSAKLGTKDGTITNAVAYKDGKYVYQGYRSESDDDGIYYNAGDKDKLLEDVEDADLNGSYEDKYAFAEDGSDQYLIDLTSGSVIDDDTPEDRDDTAKSKLKSAVKKTDRYGNVDDTDSYSITQAPGQKFGDTWYEYNVAPLDSSADGTNNTVSGKLYGFTNQTGKYIDASNVANIYAYSTEKGKTVKIDEFSNDIDDVDDDTKLLATLASAPEVLAQDKDYIYAKVTVQIYDASAKDGDITGTTTAAAAVLANVPAGKEVVTRTYIQKISKAQGDQKDDAYLPKSVDSYEITKNEFDSGDADDAYDAINEATSFSAVNGQLLAIKYAAENVKVTSINLKKDKVKYEVKGPQGIDSKDKVDVYLAEKDDDDDVDVDSDIDSEATPYDIDVDGNVWVAAEGKIYEFKNNEMTKVYTTDSSLDSISVYDENNLITWERDGDIYTTVAEGTAEENPITTPAKVGWDKLADGTWNFYDATGAKVVNNWANAGGVWYFLKADGVMATGWLKDNNGTWYYLNASGAMATGWINDNGTWYFLQSSGAMKTGWLNDNGTWYYLYASGNMATNTVIDGYTLNGSGAWVK